MHPVNLVRGSRQSRPRPEGDTRWMVIGHQIGEAIKNRQPEKPSETRPVLPAKAIGQRPWNP